MKMTARTHLKLTNFYAAFRTGMTLDHLAAAADSRFGKEFPSWGTLKAHGIVEFVGTRLALIEETGADCDEYVNVYRVK